MPWRALMICLSILLNNVARADEVVVSGRIDPVVTTERSIHRSPTIVRVIALHDIPHSSELWKPIQSLLNFESIVASHQRATGIAFAIDRLGNLATAAHVIGESRCIWIVRGDGSVLPAVVVGVDRRSDLAVIRMLDSTEPVALASPNESFSTQFTLRNGANPIFNAIDAKFIGANRSLPTLTRSSGRDYANLIEFTGAARAGDSGSPLIDSSGNAIGMLCAVIEREDSSASGFAIPLDSLNVERLRKLARGEKITHGFAGIEMAGVVKSGQPGVRIETIAHDSPAGDVFFAGDEIQSINSRPMNSAHDVSRLIDASPDQTLTVDIVRADQLMTVDLKVRPRNVEMDSISTGEFIWSNTMCPSDYFDEIVTTGSLPNEIIEASKLIGKDHNTKSIEIWRAGMREQ